MVASNGQIAMSLFAPFKMLRQRWRCDSQELESIMTMIQSGVRRAPNITLDSLDAAVGIRKSLTYDAFYDTSFTKSTAVTRKWSIFEPRARQIIEDALPYLQQCSTDVIQHPARFVCAPASAINCEKPLHGVTVPKNSSTRELKWACHFNSIWHKHARANPKIVSGLAVTAIKGVLPGSGESKLETWVCHDVLRYSGMMAEVTLIDDGNEFLRVQPLHQTEPPNIITSYDLFRRWFLWALANKVTTIMVNFLAVDLNLGGAGQLALENVDVLAVEDAEVTPLVDMSFKCDTDEPLGASGRPQLEKTFWQSSFQSIPCTSSPCA